VAGRDLTEYRRYGFAPSISLGLGTDTRFTLNYLLQQGYDRPDYGVPWYYGKSAPVGRRSFYGFKDSDYLRTNVNVVTASFEHDINDQVTVRNSFRYGAYDRDIRVTEPQIIYTGITPMTPLSLVGVTRNMIAVGSTETLLQNNADVTAHFNTWGIEHALVAGVEIGNETSSPARYTYTNVPIASLLGPNADTPFLATSRLTSNIKSSAMAVGMYAVDTIKLGERWELTGGLRWDYFQTDYSQSVAPAVYLSQTDSEPSVRASIAYKPAPNGSIYFSYGTSFNPSAEGLTLATSNADLSPEKNETSEVGTKWDFLDNRLSVTGAIFQVEKLNARVPDPSNTAFNTLGGEQRVRGFELSVSGNITEEWQIYAGYAFLNSEVVKTTLARTQGEPLANTPQSSGSLWTTYRLPWYQIQVGGGVQGMTSRLASSSPNATTDLYSEAPGYATVQLMVKVPVRPGVNLQINGYNLTNTRFDDLLHPGHVVPGAGRTVLVSTSFKF
jgi:catecholate siderophore receptor